MNKGNGSPLTALSVRDVKRGKKTHFTSWDWILERDNAILMESLIRSSQSDLSYLGNITWWDAFTLKNRPVALVECEALRNIFVTQAAWVKKIFHFRSRAHGLIGWTDIREYKTFRKVLPREVSDLLSGIRGDGEKGKLGSTFQARANITPEPKQLISD